MATILVVEDDPYQQSYLQQLLEEEGFQVRLIADGRTAYEVLLDGWAADLLLTDINLPGMQGLELVAMVRRIASHRSLPIVVRSSMDERYGEAASAKAGADCFVSKGAAAQDLLATVRGLLGRAVQGSES